MYKNGKTSYQIKKEKLQKIKKIIQEMKQKQKHMQGWYIETDWDENIKKLWEIIKNE